MPTNYENKFIWLMLVLSLIGGLVIGFQRWQVETHLQQYALVLDYEDLKTLAAQEGADPRELLQDFKKAGVSGLSVPIQTVSGLLAQGEMSYIPDGYDLTPVRQSDLKEKLQLIYQSSLGKLYGFQNLELPGTTSELSFQRTFVGPDPEALSLAENAGLKPVFRIPFFSRATETEIKRAFTNLNEYPGYTLIFEGQKVLGYPDELSAVSRLVQANNLLLGEVEFSSQRGIDQLLEEAGNNLIRVHTITGEEMDLIGFDQAVARWVRAVRERNIRLLYLHPFMPESVAVQGSQLSPVQLSMKMITQVKQDLQGAGYLVAPPRPFPTFSAAPWAFLAGTLGLLGATFSLTRRLLDQWLKPRFVALLWVLGILSVIALNLAYLWGEPVLAGQIVAFGAALVFPVLGIIKSEDSSNGLLYSWLIALGSVLAGVSIVLIALAQTTFFLQVDQFLGVKLMHVLPPLVVAAFLWQKGYFKNWNWNTISLLGLLLGVLATGYLVLRTGNIGAVANWERDFRQALEALLEIRPRTKEIFLGHPALILGLWLQSQKTARIFRGILLTVGSIGLLSIINTFTHAHTPLVISVIRTVNGVVVGAVLGILAILCYQGLKRLTLGLRGEF